MSSFLARAATPRAVPCGRWFVQLREDALLRLRRVGDWTAPPRLILEAGDPFSENRSRKALTVFTLTCTRRAILAEPSPAPAASTTHDSGDPGITLAIAPGVTPAICAPKPRINFGDSQAAWFFHRWAAVGFHGGDAVDLVGVVPAEAKRIVGVKASESGCQKP